jgi:hypothetical protein
MWRSVTLTRSTAFAPVQLCWFWGECQNKEASFVLSTSADLRNFGYSRRQRTERVVLAGVMLPRSAIAGGAISSIRITQRSGATSHPFAVIRLRQPATVSLPPSMVRHARCAARVQIRPLGIEVRAGLHTGECEMTADDVGGIAVHLGSRVAALASAGEVLVSSTVKDLVAGSGPRSTERGIQSPKGVPGEWRLFSVGK